MMSEKQCSFCGEWFKSLGIARHETACREIRKSVITCKGD